MFPWFSNNRHPGHCSPWFCNNGHQRDSSPLFCTTRHPGQCFPWFCTTRHPGQCFPWFCTNRHPGQCSPWFCNSRWTGAYVGPTAGQAPRCLVASEAGDLPPRRCCAVRKRKYSYNERPVWSMCGATLKSDTAGLPEEPCKLINPLRLLATDPVVALPPPPPPPRFPRPSAGRMPSCRDGFGRLAVAACLHRGTRCVRRFRHLPRPLIVRHGQRADAVTLLSGDHDTRQAGRSHCDQVTTTLSRRGDHTVTR